MRNNKRLGNAFERKMCELLADDGWWVHFIQPDARGMQPFDIIAVQDGTAIAIDCKTCEDHIFRLSRLEDNQRLAFQKWKSCGNSFAMLAVLYDGDVYMIDYDVLAKYGKVDFNCMEAKYHDVQIQQ